jgi:hypothetical protein
MPVRDKVVRFAADNVKRLLEGPDAPARFSLQSVWHTFLSALANEPLSTVQGTNELNAVQELLVAVGARDYDGYGRFELPGGSGSLIERNGFEERIKSSLELCSYDNLVGTAETATDLELRWARDAQSTALKWSHLFGRLLGGPRWKNPLTIATLVSRNDPARAVLLPGLLILRGQAGYESRLEDGLVEIEQQLPLLQDLSAIRAALPIEHRKRFTAAGHANLHRMRPAARDEYLAAVGDAVRAYAQSDPAVAARLERTTTTITN